MGSRPAPPTSSLNPRRTVGLLGLVMLALLAFACGPAEEPTATSAPEPTATSAPSTETETEEAEATATPAADTTGAEATATPVEAASDDASDVAAARTRPDITPQIIDRMDDMTMDEIKEVFPRSWPAEFEYGDIERGGNFRIATTWDIAKWDPRITAAGGTMAVSNMVYMSVLKFETGPDAHPLNPPLVPRLAESWEMSDDAMSLTLKLHEGMHWGDIDDPFQAGPEIVAEDVKWSLLQLRDNSVHSGAFNTIETIDTPDKYTLVLNFSQPSLWLLPNLALKDHLIVNPYLFKADRQDQEAVGPGPFILTDQAKSQFVKLKANPNYYFTDSRGGKLPYMDGVEFIVAPDQATRAAMLRTGRVETVYAGTGGTVGEAQAMLKTKPDLVITAVEATRACCISFQQNDPMWQDVNARRAIALASDVRGITDVVFQGMTAPLPLRIDWNFFLDRQPSWDDDLDALHGEYIWHHDLEKAKELWAQTGYGDITERVEYYQYYGTMADTLGLLVDDLRKIGVNLKPTSLDYSAFNGPLAQGDLPGIFWSWSPGYPEIVGTTFFRYNKNGTSNRENVNDPVLNDLTEQMRLATTFEQQQELVAPIRERILDQVYHYEFPLTPAVQLSGYMWQPYVKNFRYGTYSGGYYYWGQSLDKAWMDK